VGEEAQENSSIMYLYIQQELCQKRTLREWLRTEEKRDLRTIVNLFGQIVEAVEYVHSKKLIHRDLKPGNIFLAGSSHSSGEEHLKIGDFGLATTVLKEEGEKKGHHHEEKKDINLTSLVGTQLYMSPEQFRRKPYDYKVDIYSLGIIFFELLVPFQTEMERHDVLFQVRKAKMPQYFKDSYPEEV
jgi:translation initiation factor 2-alpha kinase 3